MNFPQTLEIAQLCPSQGGSAVFTARSFVALLNDSIEYNDAGICNAQGIFRLTHLSSSVAKKTFLSCIPNPSSGAVQLLYSGFSGNKMLVEFRNYLGQLLIKKEIISRSNSIYLDDMHLFNGLYNVTVRDEKGISVSTNLIISR